MKILVIKSRKEIISLLRSINAIRAFQKNSHLYLDEIYSNYKKNIGDHFTDTKKKFDKIEEIVDPFNNLHEFLEFSKNNEKFKNTNPLKFHFECEKNPNIEPKKGKENINI